MRLKEIQINGLKGWEFGFKATGRDLLAGRNMTGKSTVAEGLAFLFTGAIPDTKKDDLLGLGLPSRDDGTPEGFEVWAEFERPGGTTFRVIRRLVVSRSGEKVSGKQELEFIPAVPGKIREQEVHLAAEFRDSPVVHFDSVGFMKGSDTERLKALVDLCGEPETKDVKAMLLEGDFTIDQAGDLHPILSDLQAIAVLPENPLEAIGAMEEHVKTWTSGAKKEQVRSQEAFRKLGAISRQEAFGHGVNVESAEDALSKADAEVLELEKEQAAAEERRKLAASIEGDETSAQADMDRHATLIEDYRKNSVENVQALKTAEEELDGASKALALWELEALKGKDRGDARLAELAAEMDKLSEQTEFHITKRQEQGQPVGEAIHAAKTARYDADQAAKDIQDWNGLQGKNCPMCEQGISTGAYEALLEALMTRSDDKIAAAVDAEGAAKDLQDDRDRNTQAIGDLQKEIASLADEAKALENALLATANEPNPHGTAKAEAVSKVDRVQASLDRTATEDEFSTARLKEAEQRLSKARTRLTELHQGMPEDLEEGVLAGAKMERKALKERLDKARDLERRYADQETARTDMKAAEAKIEALKFWAGELKGLKAKVMQDSLGPALHPAQELLEAALPGFRMITEWEDPRGNPGLRIGLVDAAGAKTTWAGMSGTQKVMVGVALTMAVARAGGRVPALLVTDGDPFDKWTTEHFLAVLGGLAGKETDLIVTSHHPETVPEPWVVPDLPSRTGAE